MLFDMAYNSEGGFTWSELYTMPIWMRRFYFDKLHEAKKAEAEEIKKSQRKK
jgi:hypothetical protein